MTNAFKVIGDFAGKVPSIFNWFLRYAYKEENIKERTVVDLTCNTRAVRFTSGVIFFIGESMISSLGIGSFFWAAVL